LQTLPVLICDTHTHRQKHGNEVTMGLIFLTMYGSWLRIKAKPIV